MNDPHGITFRDGRYEAFFQYVPDSTEWAPNCHWGHASGPDLLSLRELPVAIAPGEGDDGVWTGCLVVDGDGTRAFYTATSVPEFGIGRVRVARPVDESWLSWVKGDVVVEAPDGLDLIAFRDPFVRREGEVWRMFVGAAGRDGTAMALSYTSRDLDRWQYDGVALSRDSCERDPVWMGALWECPQIFEVDGHAVMVSSVWDADVLHYAGCAVGAYRDGVFVPSDWAQLTWGSSLYAPSLFTDADGEPALTFWLRGIEGDGWAGAHSFPYRVAVRAGRLVAQPHPDVAAHRTESVADGVLPGLAADIEWECTQGTLLITSEGALAAELSVADGELTVGTSADTQRVPVQGGLRIIVDGPVLEVSSAAGVFATAISPRGAGLRVAADAGTVVVYGLE